MAEKKVFAIGAQNMNLVSFVRLVKEQNVTRVVDVRGKGGLNTDYGRFSPPLVKEILSNINVDYVHLHEAGEPEELREKSRENGHNSDFGKHYKEIMSSKKDLEIKIKGLFTLDNVMILSQETDFTKSIRRFFIEYVSEVTGISFKVKNLTSKDLKPMVIPPPPPFPERG